MKFNWGTGLALTLGIFIIAMGVVLYKALNQRHDLVTTDYYQQELAYQSTIDGKRNAAQLEESCSLKVRNEKLYLDFPSSLLGAEGDLELIMYFPTQAEVDFDISREQWTVASLEIPGEKLTAGKWIAKVKLKVGDTDYYFEPQIVL